MSLGNIGNAEKPKKVLTIELPEDIYNRLESTAKEMNTTPEKLAASVLEEWLAPYSLEEEKEVLERLKSMGYM